MALDGKILSENDPGKHPNVARSAAPKARAQVWKFAREKQADVWRAEKIATSNITWGVIAAAITLGTWLAPISYVLIAGVAGKMALEHSRYPNWYRRVLEDRSVPRKDIARKVLRFGLLGTALGAVPVSGVLSIYAGARDDTVFQNAGTELLMRGAQFAMSQGALDASAKKMPVADFRVSAAAEYDRLPTPSDAAFYQNWVTPPARIEACIEYDAKNVVFSMSDKAGDVFEIPNAMPERVEPWLQRLKAVRESSITHFKARIVGLEGPC